MTRFIHLLTTCLVSAVAAGCGAGEPSGIPAGDARAAAGDPGGPFTHGSYEKARAAAAKQDSLLLVDATAEWCAPCKIMDQTTWRDERLIAWIRDHALAVQLDVDRQREHARKLRIEAMPTMILFNGERELDRVIGYQSAEALLSWLEEHHAATGAS